MAEQKEKVLEDYLQELSLDSIAHKDYGTARDFLKHLRANKQRVSPLVVKYGTFLIEKGFSTMEEIEAWEVCEQVFLAALDVHDSQLAQKILTKLEKKFGQTSLRVSRLKGLFLEMEGKLQEADKLYNQILEKDPTNTLVMKRQVCLRKEMGDIPAAIKLLNEYLKIFMGDTDAWVELADLYIDQNMLKQAAFCFEEAILGAPTNYHYYIKYAELQYSVGGVENLKIARKYFCGAAELSETPRALYGVLMTCYALSSAKFAKQLEQSYLAQNMSLFEWAYEKLAQQYKEHNPSKLEFLKAFTDASKSSKELPDDK